MIKRDLRFHGRRSILRTLNSKMTVRTKSMQLKFNKSFRGKYRLGVNVSKKVSKSAVVRNHIRRRIYETFRQEKLLESLSCDVVVIVYDPEIQNWPNEKLVSALREVSAEVRKSIGS